MQLESTHSPRVEEMNANANDKESPLPSESIATRKTVDPQAGAPTTENSTMNRIEGLVVNQVEYSLTPHLGSTGRVDEPIAIVNDVGETDTQENGETGQPSVSLDDNPSKRERDDQVNSGAGEPKVESTPMSMSLDTSQQEMIDGGVNSTEAPPSKKMRLEDGEEAANAVKTEQQTPAESADTTTEASKVNETTRETQNSTESGNTDTKHDLKESVDQPRSLSEGDKDVNMTIEADATTQVDQTGPSVEVDKDVIVPTGVQPTESEEGTKQVPITEIGLENVVVDSEACGNGTVETEPIKPNSQHEQIRDSFQQQDEQAAPVEPMKDAVMNGADIAPKYSASEGQTPEPTGSTMEGEGSTTPAEVGNEDTRRTKIEVQTGATNQDISKDVGNGDTSPQNTGVQQKGEPDSSTRNTKPSLNGGKPGDNKTTPKHVRSKKADPKVLEIRRRIQFGCRDNDLSAALKAYEEAVANDIRVEAQSFYNLLNLCDGLERTVHVGTPKSTKENGEPADAKVDDPTDKPHLDHGKRQELAFQLKEHMGQLEIPLSEAAFTAIVKILVRNKDYKKAEQVLEESKAVPQCRPKLRLYAPLLAAYCEERRMVDALQCWLQVSQQKLDLSEKEASQLLRCAIATGDQHVFSRVLSNIADEVAVPSKESVAAILEWFESAHAIHTPTMRVPKQADEGRVVELLKEIHLREVEAPPSMEPVVNRSGWTVSSAVPIDTKVGVLQGGNLDKCTLKPVPLSTRAWSDMRQMNESIVLEGQVEGNKSSFQGGRKGKMRNDFDPQERVKKWQYFRKFLERTGPIDVVVDAANVGYYKQNFASAPKHVDYDQIGWVARHLREKLGKRVLLILHQRHFHPKQMPGKFKPLQEEWERQGILYKTPAGMNDDWFWLHAALQNQAMVVTNDEMRDHHFQMLAPQIFLRWKERHQVHFEFGDWTNNNKEGRTVQLEFPARYSRRVQRVEDGLVVPLIKRGDENRFLDGNHVACDDEPMEETYLCIRPVKKAEGKEDES